MSRVCDSKFTMQKYNKKINLQRKTRKKIKKNDLSKKPRSLFLVRRNRQDPICHYRHLDSSSSSFAVFGRLYYHHS